MRSLAVVVSVVSVVSVAMAAPAAHGSAPANASRVYVARLRAAQGVDEAASNALEEAVLVAAKKARPDLTVLGRSDVATLADLQAEQNAAGCDAESCAAEIADAVGAPQIVTGKLTRLGSTWILSLTRLERGSLSVLARESVEKQGSSAEVLVAEVPGLVARVFDAKAEHEGHADRDDAKSRVSGGFSGLAVAGGVGVGAGAVAATAGGALLAWSLSLYDDARKADAAGDQNTVKQKISLGEPANFAGWTALGAGAVVAVVGGALLVAGLAE